MLHLAIGLRESAGRVEYTALSISVNVSMLVPQPLYPALMGCCV